MIIPCPDDHGKKGNVETWKQKENLLTYAGLKKLEDELHDLKVVKRKEVAEKIKGSQRTGRPFRECRVRCRKKMNREISNFVLKRLRRILKNAEVVVEDEVDEGKINVGCKVKVLDMEFDEEMEFTAGWFHRSETACRKKSPMNLLLEKL